MRRVLGAGLWALSAQYFAAEVLVARSWSAPDYDWVRNYISDLGARTVGVTGDRAVDSPWAPLMNGSFLVQGGLAATGALLLAPQVPARRGRGLLVGLFVAHGAGVAAVGLVPSEPGASDLQSGVHYAAALLAIGAGTAALLVAAVVLRRAHRGWAAAAGVLGLSAAAAGLTMLLGGTDAPGVLERVAAWPVTLWMTAVGTTLLVRELRAVRS